MSVELLKPVKQIYKTKAQRDLLIRAIKFLLNFRDEGEEAVDQVLYRQNDRFLHVSNFFVTELLSDGKLLNMQGADGCFVINDSIIESMHQITQDNDMNKFLSDDFVEFFPLNKTHKYKILKSYNDMLRYDNYKHVASFEIAHNKNGNDIFKTIDEIINKEGSYYHNYCHFHIKNKNEISMIFEVEDILYNNENNVHIEVFEKDDDRFDDIELFLPFDIFKAMKKIKNGVKFDFYDTDDKDKLKVTLSFDIEGYMFRQHYLILIKR